MRVATTLLVEDNAETRAWLHDCVVAAFPDARVVLAEDVASGLTAIEAADFTLAIVDLGLPDGSGVELITALRGSATYIVVATIYDDDKSLFTALKSGARGYILKDQDKARVVSYLKGIQLGEAPLSNAVARRLIQHFNAKGDAREMVPLAPREEDVLKLIAKGFSVSDTARILGLTNNTVKGYVKTVYAKLGVSSRAEATTEAIRLGLVDLD
jgi:DNA-binding NarL/FixJ family response regulator